MEIASVLKPKLMTCVWNVEYLAKILKTRVQEEIRDADSLLLLTTPPKGGLVQILFSKPFRSREGNDSKRAYRKTPKQVFWQTQVIDFDIWEPG